MAIGFSNVLDKFKSAIDGGKDNAVVGVDIGSSSIKVVELYKNKDVPTLNTYGELQLGPYADIDIGRTTNLKVATLAQALIDIVRESSVATKDVALSISYNSSFATIVTISATEEEEIARQVPVEAKKYIPVPMNTVSLDWFTVGRDTNGNSRVLIAAIHNDALKRYKSTVAGAGLKTKFTEIEAFSTIRSSVSKKDGSVVVLEVGASVTRLYIARRGTILRTHSIRMGGSEFTSIIADTLGAEFSTAEEMKRSGLQDAPEAKRALDKALERGLREVRQVMEHYTQEESDSIEKVILSGGGSLLKELDAATEDMLGVPAVHSNPFGKVAYPAFLEDVLTEVGPSFSVAVGAALQPLVTGQ